VEVNPGNEWMAWIPIAIGPLAIALGVWQLRVSRRFRARGVSARGVYVERERERGTAYGMIEYTTESGETHRHRGALGVPWAGRWKGREITVLYDPDNPSRARLDTFSELWLPGGIFTLGGVWFLAAGVVALALL
jgi:hypothetical protein